jgi:hypothetical protein
MRATNGCRDSRAFAPRAACTRSWLPCCCALTAAAPNNSPTSGRIRAWPGPDIAATRCYLVLESRKFRHNVPPHAPLGSKASGSTPAWKKEKTNVLLFAITKCGSRASVPALP